MKLEDFFKSSNSDKIVKFLKDYDTRLLYCYIFGDYYSIIENFIKFPKNYENVLYSDLDLIQKIINLSLIDKILMIKELDEKYGKSALINNSFILYKNLIAEIAEMTFNNRLLDNDANSQFFEDFNIVMKNFTISLNIESLTDKQIRAILIEKDNKLMEKLYSNVDEADQYIYIRNNKEFVFNTIKELSNYLFILFDFKFSSEWLNNRKIWNIPFNR